jgi:hypothetical protein
MQEIETGTAASKSGSRAIGMGHSTWLAECRDEQIGATLLRSGLVQNSNEGQSPTTTVPHPLATLSLRRNAAGQATPVANL